jgi:hypothetical protein
MTTRSSTALAALVLLAPLAVGCSGRKEIEAAARRADSAAVRAEDAARRAESSASRVEDAARRAEAAAGRAEVAFQGHMRK